MCDESKPEEKKIIIDEDWKSRVEAEKDSAGREQETSSAGQAESAEDSGAPLPPANLVFLASGLYLQGMVSLGLLPNPASDKPKLYLDQARHAVDTLQMLQEKTEGNRTPEESEELHRMLHELRMAYVSVQPAEEE